MCLDDSRQFIECVLTVNLKIQKKIYFVYTHNALLARLYTGRIKDGAYYCYCAYVLRISRYSDFLSPMLTNTGIFLRGLKISGESRS